MQPEILDKLFRLNNFYHVITKDAELKAFQLNKAQLHFHKNKAKRNIILKSRRIGFTTYSAIDMLDNTLFTPNFQSLFLSYDDDSSTQVFDNIIFFNWLHFPQYLKEKYRIDTSNAKALKIDFGDKTFSQIIVKSSGRGSGLNHIHISELGKIANKYPHKAREIMSGTIPALSSQGFLTIESTAEGEDNLFHELWVDAVSNPEAYKDNPKALKPFFYNWQWDVDEIRKVKHIDQNIPKEFKEYQKKHNELSQKNPQLFQPITDLELTFWYQKYVECGKKMEILLENYPTTADEAFTTSGNKVFTQESVAKQVEFISNPVEFQGNWQIFKVPNPRHSYVMGIDPSEGVGKDHSAITIIDISTPKIEVVAHYASNLIDPDLLAFEARNKAILYANAFIVVERNNTGHATLTRLKDIYPEDKIYTEHKEEFTETKETDRLGFVSTSKSKGDIFFNLKSLLDNLHILIFSQLLLSEIKTYGLRNLRTVKQDDDVTNHYDLLTSLALACHGARYADDQNEDVVIYVPKRT